MTVNAQTNMKTDMELIYMKLLRCLMVGGGQRGDGMCVFLGKTPRVRIDAVCDLYEDRAVALADKVEKNFRNRPEVYTDVDEACKHDIDAVYIASSWETHIPFAIKFMELGIPVMLEVGGAYSVDDCFRLVETYERTKTPIVMLENCCFDKAELLGTCMARNGLFGEIVHCEGAYAHDLREEITFGEENRHYRLRNYINRNCENYPTHEIGPIAKLLNINRGNRMVSLVSVASKAAGLEHYIKNNDKVNPELKNQKFNQGDVVTTIITCAGGETITIKLDTTLPRHYRRNFIVQGTKGLYEQDANMVYLDGMKENFKTIQHYLDNINNAVEYEEKYLCDEWKNLTEDDLAEGGHGGMDVLVLRMAVDCILDGKESPIDVYDIAAWMVITPLSEQSIQNGGAPQAIPDFTHGNWTMRKPLDVVNFPVYND